MQKIIAITVVLVLLLLGIFAIVKMFQPGEKTDSGQRQYVRDMLASSGDIITLEGSGQVWNIGQKNTVLLAIKNIYPEQKVLYLSIEQQAGGQNAPGWLMFPNQIFLPSQGIGIMDIILSPSLSGNYLLRVVVCEQSPCSSMSHVYATTTFSFRVL